MTWFRAAVMLLATLAAVGVMVYWIIPHLEQVEDEQRVDVSPEARRNRFLAMERFLHRVRTDVEVTARAEVLADLPPPGDTIIASYTGEVMTSDRLYDLEEWVSRGGHLILEVNVYRWSGTDFLKLPLLFALNAETIPKERQVEREHGSASTVVRAGTGEQYQLEVPGGYVLHDLNGEARVWRNTEGAHALQYAVDQGTFTVISDLDLWSNSRIGEHDHAAFLATLVGSGSGKIWMLRNTAYAPLWRLLWERAWPLVVSLGVALILGLWGLHDRFGPFIPRSDLRRRSLLEHFDAAARFAWRYGRGVVLMKCARQELRHRIERVYPGWQRKTRQEQIDWLAARVQREPEAIRQALEAPVSEIQPLIETISLLQLIRKNL